jgi:hypothetical protein
MEREEKLMGTRTRRLIGVCLMALIAVLATAATSPAAKKRDRSKPAAWAKQHELRGKWRNKDRDGDGLTNIAEFKARTDPRRKDTDSDKLRDGIEVKLGLDPRNRDSDGDGIRDGKENAATIVAFDGQRLTLRLARGGQLTAPVDPDVELSCRASEQQDAAEDDLSDDVAEDDVSDEAAWDEAGDAMDDDAGADDVADEDDSADDESGTDVADPCTPLLKAGSLVREAELEVVDGGRVFVAIEFADAD